MKLEKRYLSELKVAEEFLEASEKNLNESLRTSANRLYFAFEKAIISYLYFKNIRIPKNHQKIWELSAEMLGEEYYSLLRELYDLRVQADYGSMSVFADLSVKNVSEKMVKVRSLFNKIKKRIENE